MEQELKLTPRELEVLVEVTFGLSSKEIAAKLDICEPTVETHRKKIILKLKCKNMPHAISVGFRQGILS